MAATRPEPVFFRTSEEIKSQPRPFMAGYLRHLEGTQLFCQAIAQSPMPCGIMAFGWPGTGKSVFPNLLAYNLNEAGCSCGLAYIRCQALTARYSVDDVRERLASLEDFIARTDEPKLIVFDELDALAPTRKDNPALMRLSTWAMDFLDFGNPGLCGSVVAGITNNPEEVEAAVRDRLSCSLYFELPDKKVITSIFDHKKITGAEKVAEALWQELAKNGYRPTGRGAFQAAELAQALLGAPALSAMKARDIAKFMREHCRGVSEEEVDNFRFRHRGLIAQSSGFLSSWIARGAVKV